MRVLMTGASGFIGTQVASWLAKKNIDLVGVDLVKPPLGSPITCLEGSFADKDFMGKVLRERKITHIIHLAATTVPASSNLNIIYDVESNVVGSISLIETAVKCGIKKFIYLSSGGTVYGRSCAEKLDEKHPTEPICSYGIAKLTIEKYLGLFSHLDGLDHIILRAANPFGPGQRHDSGQGLIATFVHKIKSGDEIEIWGDGSVVRDYFYVADLAELVELALRSDATGVFNAGSGVGTSVSEMLRLVESLLQAKSRKNYRPGRQFDVDRLVLNCEAACSTFGWRPRTSLTDGVKRYIDWYNKNRAE